MFRTPSAVWRQYIQLKKDRWGWVHPKLVCWNWVRSLPLPSLQVRLRGVGACYLKGFRTVGEKSTAFTRQGSLVQIQPRPPISAAFRPFWLTTFSHVFYCAETLRLVYQSKYSTKLNRYIVVITFPTVLPKTPMIKALLLKRL